MTLNIKVPSKATLKKYGLSAEEFSEIWRKQGSVCPICNRVPTTGRVNIDHHHVPKWKQMPPERRKTFVRGILCWHCNHQVLRALTLAKAEACVMYLKACAERVK